MTYPAPYGTYTQQQPPRKKRGLKRIIFGVLGIVANGIGLIVMPFVAAVAVAVFAVLGATPVSLGGSTGTVDASGTSLYYVYVPTADADATTCTADGGSSVDWEADAEAALTTSVNGTEYTQIGTLQATTAQEVTLTCDGAEDVAVAEIGVIGTLVGGAVGIAIPVLLGLVAIALLIWGIIARVRS